MDFTLFAGNMQGVILEVALFLFMGFAVMLLGVYVVASNIIDMLTEEADAFSEYGEKLSRENDKVLADGYFLQSSAMCSWAKVAVQVRSGVVYTFAMLAFVFLLLAMSV